jgi:hypothetical protein
VAPNVHNLAAILDLNGDAKLEVIVHSFYYEAAKQPSTVAIEEVLSVDCGA